MYGHRQGQATTEVKARHSVARQSEGEKPDFSRLAIENVQC